MSKLLDKLQSAERERMEREKSGEEVAQRFWTSCRRVPMRARHGAGRGSRPAPVVALTISYGIVERRIFDLGTPQIGAPLAESPAGEPLKLRLDYRFTFARTPG